MNMHRNTFRQAGASLMEVLVAMSLSLVVTASMIALMSNSLGSTTRIVKMTKLADDMRIAMQMVTRDLRRSSYNASAMLCYGNPDCGTNAGIVVADEIQFVDVENHGACVWFEHDREQNQDGNSTNDGAGGFRRRAATRDGEVVGWLEMYTGDGRPNADCSGNDGWVAITDADSMNITTFTVDDSESWEELILQDVVNNRQVWQDVRKIRITMRGELVVDPTVVRRMEDIVSVRNDHLRIVNLGA